MKAANELVEIFPSDAAFKEAFLVKQERTAKKAHFILYKLEIEAIRNAGKRVEFQPDKNLTVEHVLPKNPNQDWSNLFHDHARNIEDYKYRIGNMCLLDKNNRSLGSKGFELKKKTYKESSLILTKSISKIKNWSFENIEKRQLELADLALKAWPSPYSR